MSNASPKVLVVDLSVAFGGASSRVLALMQALPSGETLLASLHDSPVTRAAGQKGLPFICVARSKYDPRIPMRLAKMAERHGLAIIDTQNIQSKVWGTLASRLAGTVLVSTLNSWYATELAGSLRGMLYHCLEKLTACATQHYIVVSDEIRDKLVGSGVPAGSVSTILNAVMTRPTLNAAGRLALRTELGVRDDQTMLVAVGRLAEAKGYPWLLESMQTGIPASVRLIIVGDGPMRAMLEKDIVRRGLQDRVYLTGWQSHDRTTEILEAADIFIMPSITEGTPMALLEAMSMNLPIVATRVGSIPRVIDHGHEGLLVAARDSAALGQAVSHLLSDPEDARSMGQAAGQRVRRDHAPDQWAARIRTAYRKAMETRT